MKTLSNKYLGLLAEWNSAQTQKFTSSVLTLIALSFFSLFVISPTLSTIAKLKKEIADSTIVNQGLEKKIAALASLQQAYSRLKNDVPLVLESIPQSALVPLFIGQVQSVARSSNVSLNQMQNLQVDLFEQNEAPKRYYSYSFSLTADGTYEDISKFMENITNMQRVVGIDVSSIDKAGDANKSLRLNLQGVVYYKK